MTDKELATELKEYANKLLSHSSSIEQIDIRLDALAKLEPDVLVTVNVSTTVAQVPSDMAIRLLAHARQAEFNYFAETRRRCVAALDILKGGQ